MWFGITHEGVEIYVGKWLGISRQELATIWPIVCRWTLSSSTTPRRHSRPDVKTVTKYAPGDR